jgi:hypothetical protein
MIPLSYIKLRSASVVPLVSIFNLFKFGGNPPTISLILLGIVNSSTASNLDINGGKENTFRLNYSNMPEEKIVEGIKRLSVALKEAMTETVEA